MGAGDDLQVGPSCVGRDVSAGRTPAFPVLLGDLGGRGAKLARAVVIRVARQPLRLASLQEGLVDDTRAAQVADVQRPADAAVVVGAEALVVLGLLEQGQDLFIGPARVAERCPAVVVLAVAAGVNHGIDRRASTQHLATRLKAGAPVQARLGNRVVAPAVNAQRRRRGKPQGRADEGRSVGSAGFEQAHRDGRVFAEPAGHHATTRATAHDNVVKLLQFHGTRLSILPPARQRVSEWVDSDRTQCPSRQRALAGSATGDEPQRVRKFRYRVANFP